MLFRSIAVSTLAGLVAADYASIAASLQTIDKDTLKLDSSLQAYDGNIIFALPILGDNIQLNSDLSNGTTVANDSAPLTATEAANLISPVQKLAGDVNITVTDLINKYPAFASNNLTAIVLLTLEATKSNADAYSSAIISKVPADLQSTAQSIAAPISDSFNQAIAVYQK